MNYTKKHLMRRIYFSYALSYVEQPLLYVGLLLGGAIALFGRWTHVSSITENLLATPLGQVPIYVSSSFMSAIARGELGTVLVVLAIASLSAFAWYQLYHAITSPRLRYA